MTTVKLGARRETISGWYCIATVDGVDYHTGVERGRPVRIAFKPRGQNRGFKWYGFVRTKEGKELWSGDVPKSLGVRGLLLLAQLLPDHRCKPGRGECAICASRRRREARVAAGLEVGRPLEETSK